jgi:hypothetical protein
MLEKRLSHTKCGAVFFYIEIEADKSKNWLVVSQFLFFSYTYGWALEYLFLKVKNKKRRDK